MTIEKNSLMEWVDLGELPVKGDKTSFYEIPLIIPDEAKEIQVYTWIATGDCNHNRDVDFAITVNDDGHKDVGMYMHAVGFTQTAWSYNSQSSWLPMPHDREIRAERKGKEFDGNVGSKVIIVGYKS